MTIDPNIAKVQPGEDRTLLDTIPPPNMLSFDLETPETVSDEYKGAAARRISETFKVPDPDGRMWRSDKGAFPTGAEYLDYMRGMVKSGNIWEYSATPELKEFTKADAAGRLAIAKKSLGFAENAAGAISKTLTPEGYGLPDNDPRLSGAPQDVLAANSRMRMRQEAVSAGDSEPSPEEKADRAAVDNWRTQRDDAALINEHHGKLMEKNVALVYLSLAPSLSDKGREIAANAFNNRKLAGSDIADFQRLDEKEQAIIAKLARMARKPVEGTFFNTMGDTGIGFLNGILSTPLQAVEQLGSVDRKIFGKMSGIVDDAELNRRAREKQRLMEALDDSEGINPSGAEHGYLARAIVGAASTLPYMAYASVPYVGGAVIAAQFMQQVDDQIAQEGGDVYGKGAEGLAYQLVAGALYCGVEKVQALPVFGKDIGLAKNIMFVKLFSKHGAAAAEQVALHIGKDTFEESLEEGVQGIIQQHAASVGLNRGPGWRESFNQGVSDFTESLGTMGIIAGIGSGRQAYSARSQEMKDRLFNTAVNAHRQESFLLADNPYAGRATEEEAGRALGEAYTEVARYKEAWAKGGTAALVKKYRMSEDEAAIVDHAFSADTADANSASFIEGRNIYMRTASKGVAHEDDTPESIRKLVAESGAQAQEKLMERGYTESGAAKVAEYYTAEADSRKLMEGVIKDIAARRAADWAQPEAKDKRAREAADIAAEIQPLRSIFQRAGTVKNAVKEFTALGFKPDQSKDMAAMFENEHRLATSPQAAAAFRAAYLDSSEEETAAERLKRMTGFEAEAAPEHGDGAARLTLKDNDGKVLGRILYLPDQTVDFDPEGRHAWEAVNAALPDTVTAAEWQAWTPGQRKAFAEENGIRPKGGFEVTDENDPSIRADGAQADLLTGKLTLTPDAPSATLYHEAAHAWAAVFRRAGKLTEADIQKLQTAYGVAEDDKNWFNEEKFADDIREIGAARDFTPDRTLASRFVAAVRRFAGEARHEQAQRKGSADAHQALFESVVYGRAFDGVGDLKALTAKAEQDKASDTATDPMAGAVTAKTADAPAAEPAEQKPAGSRKPVMKADTTIWTAATPQGNVRVSGKWVIAPRDRFISDTDPRYDFSLQGRTRDTTTASAEQVASIAAKGKLDALRLMDSPDTANGAPIAAPVQLTNPTTGNEETYYMVLSGNGRFRALDQVDADNRGDEYRNPIKLFADEKGIPYKPEDMTANAKPRLARIISEKLDDATLQKIATLSNQNAVLQMSDAEQASADAELIARDDTAGLFSANKDGLPSKTGSDAFFSWFARATGDASLLDSKGNPTDAARDRARRAMLAFAIGKGEAGKPTVAAFTENADALGLERQRDALLMSAGTLSAIENMKPDYGLSSDLSRAAAAILSIARDRKSGKTASAETFLQQGDMLNPLPAATAAALRILDSNRPAEGIAEAFRRYADLASKIDTDTPDMFGEPPTPKDALLKKAFDDTSIPEGVRYSIAIAARRYALSVNMPAEGEKLLASQLEFLFARRMDPEYQLAVERSTAKRMATLKQKKRDGIMEIRDATARALSDPDAPALWQQAFDKAGDTVSRVIHDFFIQDGPQRFPSTYEGKSIIGLKIKTAHDVASLLMPLRNPYQESMKVILLDDNNRVLGAEVVTVGLLNSTLSHPREMFKKGIKLGAKKIIFSHNHPGGDPTPSDEDRKATDRLTEAGRILGIEYFDHIITNGSTFYSFKDASIHAVDNEIPDWEAIPAASGNKIEKPYEAASLANVLRQSPGDYIHAILLDTRNRIAAVHRIPFDAKTTLPITVMRSVFKAAAANATHAIILDLTAEGITRDTAAYLHRTISEQSRIMGMQLFDSIYQDKGWAMSIKDIERAKPDFGILPLTSKAAENKDVRYSLSSAPYGRDSEAKQIDADYMAAVQRGDMETAQKIVKDAASANGYTVGKVFHGTRSDFTRFSKEKIGQANDHGYLGRGFYFTTNRIYAGQYATMGNYGEGGHVMEVFLKADQPYPIEKEELQKLLDSNIDDNVAEITAFTNELIDNGYDSVFNNEEVMVIDPKQIKLADPVTYDEAGNVIPPSKRFNQSTDDIRYSLTANTYDDARRILEPLAGVELTNAENGLTASLSQKSIKKILSGVAVKKSVSLPAHLHAAANIARLFRDGSELYTEPGRKGEVETSHKVFAAFPFNGQTLIAKITVQEYKGKDSNRIYSVEALDVQKPGGILAPAGANQSDSPLPAFVIDKITQMVSLVNLRKEKLEGRLEEVYTNTLPASSKETFAKLSGQVNSNPAPSQAIRYSLDITGRAYDKESHLVGFMASQELALLPFPSKNTVALYAQGIGLESYDYTKLAAEARALARNTEDAAIRKALTSGDPTKAAYAIGELSRKAARALVRSGAREGIRLAKNADSLRGMTEANARRTMNLMTGADYASIENDTGIDIALTILLADPKKFNPQAEAEKKPAAAAAAGANLADEQKPAETADTNPETDEDAPGLTDQQRAEIVRKRAEHEAHIKDFLAEVAKQGTKNRFREEERRRKAKEAKAAADASGDTSSTAGTGDAASGVDPETAPQQEEDYDPALPIDFTDRWEAAAFLRVWAFDRFSRDNPNHLTRDITKDRVALAFYQKTVVKELTELAQKLLEPGYKREVILLSIGDITTGLSANEIERQTAYIFGRLNKYAVRDGTKKLIKQFRSELKRQYIKGEKFEELGVDLGRTITGGVEEDARYADRICELSEKHIEGKTSPLSQEEARLDDIINERQNLKDMDGNPIAVGDDDVQLRKALRQKALLAQYGGMVDMMPGEILDLTGKALDAFGQEAIALRQRWEKYDLTVKSIRDPLAASILARGIDAPAVEPTAFGGIVDSLTGMLRLRLDNLTRFADPKKREPARAAIADMMDLMAQGNTEHAIALQGDEAALVGALGQILTRPDGRPDQRRIREYLKRMDHKIPVELSTQLTRQQRQGLMTYGQMIQLLTSLEQTGGFMRNILKNGREKQAELIRSYTYEDPKTGEIKKALTNEDMLFVEWLRREFYPQKRGVLSVIFQRLCGRPVDNPDPLYCPVKFLIQKITGMNDVYGSAWQAIDGVFSRRVSHTLDFDENASVIDMFRDRSQKSALLTAFGERGLVLREVLTSRQFQDAIKSLYGQKAGQEALSQILEQVTQSLNGGKTAAKNDKQTAAFDLAMKVTTYIGIGWNLQSAFKQTASLPVFAASIGWRKLSSIIMGPVDRDAIRRLKESDEYRVRYGTGPASGMDIASRGAYEDPDKSVFQKFFCDWGLFANRKADWIISAWIGQGVYRDLKAKYLDGGMDEATAERRAISETFSVIEETQQSGRTENTMAFTRNYGRLGKVFTQFATSPLQQMQYELVSFNEWRDLVNNKGPAANIAEARNRFMRALFINHVIVPLIMTGIAGLYKGATGGEPDWKKDGFWQILLISSIMGQFSRILFAGALTEQALRVLFLRAPPNMGQLIPAEGIIRFSATMAYPVRDIALWDMEHFQSDIKRALKSTAVTRLPTVLYENYTGKKEE